MLESYPPQQAQGVDNGSGVYAISDSFETLELIEKVAVYAFTVEYLLRLCFHEGSRLGFVTNAFNLIDLCAILPWYLEQFSFGHKGLDALRVLRVLRLFRLLRHSADLKMFMTCLSRSLDSFKLLGLFGVFAVTPPHAHHHVTHSFSCVCTDIACGSPSARIRTRPGCGADKAFDHASSVVICICARHKLNLRVTRALAVRPAVLCGDPRRCSSFPPCCGMRRRDSMTRPRASSFAPTAPNRLLARSRPRSGGRSSP